MKTKIFVCPACGKEGPLTYDNIVVTWIKTFIVNSFWGVDVDVTTVVSSGPFVLQDYVPGQRIVFGRNPHYYAAKGALATMTVGLARELAGTGVRVNLVSPGIIRTPEVEAAYLKRGRAKGWGETFEEIEPVAARDIPIRRFVTRDRARAMRVHVGSKRARQQRLQQSVPQPPSHAENCWSCGGRFSDF